MTRDLWHMSFDLHEILLGLNTFMSAPVDIRIISNLSSPDWWSNGITVASTIIGAIIGGLIAYVVARQTANESRREAEKVRREAEESSTFRAGLRIMDLANEIAGYHLGAEREIERGRQLIHADQIESWRVMRGFSGKPREIHVDANDLVVFMKARKFSYVTEVFHLVSRYNAMIYSAEDYGRRREILMEKFRPSQMSGILGTVEMDSVELRQLAPDIAAINELAEQTRTEMKDLYEFSQQVVRDFGPIVRGHFKDDKFPIPGLVAEMGEGDLQKVS